jgi:hypothetical protein
MTITEFAAVCRMKTRPEDETIGRAALLGSEGARGSFPDASSAGAARRRNFSSCSSKKKVSTDEKKLAVAELQTTKGN